VEHFVKVLAGLNAEGDSVFVDNLVFRDSAGASHPSA